MLSATIDLYDLKRVEVAEKESYHKGYGVSTTLVYVVSAMASDSSAYGKLATLRAFSYRLIFKVINRLGSYTAGASYEHLAFVFGVEVNESASREETFLHSLSTIHSRLFGDGEHAFELTHREIAFQKGQASRDAYTVVGTQSGVLSYHPAIFHHIFDRVLEKVVRYAFVFLAHHILMGLKHERRYVFLTCTCLTSYADITYFISFDVKSVLGSPFYEILGHRLLVT